MLHSSLLEKTRNYIEHKDTIMKQINVMMFSLMLKPQQDSRQRQIQQKEESGKSLAATGLVKVQKKI